MDPLVVQFFVNNQFLRFVFTSSFSLAERLIDLKSRLNAFKRYLIGT